MVLALEFWTLPFHFLMNAPANFAVFASKLPLGGQGPERLPRWDLGSMAGGLQTTSQLAGGLQTTSQLVGGLQTTSQLVGGLQTTNQLDGGFKPPTSWLVVCKPPTMEPKSHRGSLSGTWSPKGNFKSKTAKLAGVLIKK